VTDIAAQDRIISFPDVRGADVVFDLDGTLLQGDLGETVFYLLLLNELGIDGDLPALLSHDEISLPASQVSQCQAQTLKRYLALMGRGELARAYKLTAQLVGSYPAEDIRSKAAEILSANVSPVRLALHLPASNQQRHAIMLGACVRPKMAQLARGLRERDARLWIVSASPQPVVEACSDLMDIPRGNVKGALTSGGDNRVTRFPWKAEKARALREQGVNAPLLVFGNGVEDLDMLQQARMPVVVWDAKPALLELARRRGWPVLGDATEIEWV